MADTAKPWLSLALLAGGLVLLPLSGCMSSGASGFSDAGFSGERVAARDNIDNMQEIPLDIATTGAIEHETELAAAMPQPDAMEEDAPLPVFDGEPMQPASANSLVPQNMTENGIVSPRGPASREALELQAKTEARLAAIDANVRTDTRGEVSPSSTAAYPAEAAAEARLPALYASIDHGQCKQGWAPKPKRINAARIDPAHRYYMEMRMRHTPLLPVGHVYVAYGRLGPDGEPLDEKLTMLSPVGGYVGAGIAGAVPMPGILTPVGADCTIQPEAAYRISLSAQEYEKLLLSIRKQHEEKPYYHLYAYNCNHYMSEVVSVLGILPPENIYQPSLTYFYAMMDRNEGRKVPRTPGAATVAAASLPAKR